MTSHAERKPPLHENECRVIIPLQQEETAIVSLFAQFWSLPHGACAEQLVTNNWDLIYLLSFPFSNFNRGEGT